MQDLAQPRILLRDIAVVSAWFELTCMPAGRTAKTLRERARHRAAKVSNGFNRRTEVWPFAASTAEVSDTLAAHQTERVTMGGWRMGRSLTR